MKYLILIMFLGFGQSVLAQPAIYQGGTLSIPQGAAIEAGGRLTYYENIVLSVDQAGLLTPVSAEPRPLVGVETVTVNVMESLPVQVGVTVSGQKSVPCVALLPPAVARSETGFQVVLAETVLGPAESCIAVLDPFETTVTLNTSGLAAGTYEVDVNGMTTEFVLESDSP